ncbi:TrkH family potassium uptake protein [Aestuariivita boseongensis]|uniref:TrkH family potassium uptake protein n=1 Tax=Aestuariivita boseongensis TaxID=1470562 RepID=UPI000AE6EC72|nr:potassium transporter TrkG [Aestuariivita boseongensis]
MSGRSPEFARRGQAAAAVRARVPVVAETLGRHAPVVALPVAVPGVAALAERQFPLAISLLLPAAFAIAMGLALKGVNRDIALRRIEAVASLALIFVLSAVLAIPGFIVLGLSPLDALFEAVSGITTTGLSVATSAESWPIAGHLLRSWLQWCGGVVVAVAGVALLMDAGRAARVLGEQSVSGTDYAASARAKARLILMGYGALTGFGVALSIPLFPGWWEGPMVALSAVSTGGFSPRDNSLADYSLAAQIFAIMLSVATAVSLLFYPVAWKLGLREALRRGTVLATLGILLGGGLIYGLGHILLNGWEPRAMIAGVLNQLSAQTTAGFSSAPILPASPLILVLIVAMMFGGDVGSTTGGIKTARVTMLMRMVALIFLRLRLPDRAVSHLKIGARRADAEAILFSAALLAIYLAAALIFWAALYAGGYPAMAALFDAVSALSAVGHSAGVIGPDLADWLKVMAIAAMLLGRLEFFALIALVLPSTWISRR